MEGPLLHQLKGTQKWKQFHCWLNPTCFYYSDKTDSKQVSSIPLNLIKSITAKEGNSKSIIVTVNDGTILSFLARSKGEAIRWSTLMQDPLSEFPTIAVAIPCARNLTAADANGFSDPFCHLSVLDAEGKMIVKLETHKIMKTLNPEWGFMFYVSEELNALGVPESEWPNLTLLFEVFDWDAVGTNDFLGQCKLVLGKLPLGSTKQEWITLEQRENRKDDVSGQIKVGVFWETRMYQQKKATFSFGRNIQALPGRALSGFSAPIPEVLIKMQEYLLTHGGLQTVGIFRLAPNEREADEVKAALNEGRFTGCSDVNCIAHLLKVWCRDLPVRLMQTVNRAALSVAAASDQEAGKLINSLFDPEASVLSWILDLCVKVSACEEENKMNAKNLAIVFAPNLGARIDDPMEEHKQVKDLTEWMERAIVWRRNHPEEKMQAQVAQVTQLQAEEVPAAEESLEELALAAMYRQIAFCLDLGALPDSLHAELHHLLANENSVVLKRATAPANNMWQFKPADKPFYVNMATGESAWAPPAGADVNENSLSRARPSRPSNPAASAPQFRSQPSLPQTKPGAAAPPSKLDTRPAPLPVSNVTSPKPQAAPSPVKKTSIKKGKESANDFDPNALYADFGEFNDGGKKKSKKK